MQHQFYFSQDKRIRKLQKVKRCCNTHKQGYYNMKKTLIELLKEVPDYRQGNAIRHTLSDILKNRNTINVNANNIIILIQATLLYRKCVHSCIIAESLPLKMAEAANR